MMKINNNVQCFELILFHFYSYAKYNSQQLTLQHTDRKTPSTNWSQQNESRKSNAKRDRLTLGQVVTATEYAS